MSRYKSAGSAAATAAVNDLLGGGAEDLGDIAEADPYLKVSHKYAANPPMWKPWELNKVGKDQIYVHTPWQSDGFPFVKQLYTDVPMYDPGSLEASRNLGFPGTPDWVDADGAGPDATSRALDRVDMYVKAYAKDEEKKQHEFSKGSAEASGVFPKKELEKIRKAFANRDTTGFLDALVQMSAYEKGLAESVPFEERVEAVSRVLQQALQPSMMADRRSGAKFVIDALKPALPPDLAEVMEDATRGNEYERMRKMAMARFKNSTWRGDEAMTVIAPPDFYEAWEVNYPGLHPGVMFGSHCAGTCMFSDNDYDFGRDWVDEKGMHHPWLLPEKEHLAPRQYLGATSKPDDTPENSCRTTYG